MTYFRVSPGDELPIYRQIIRQLVQAIAGGRVRSGEQLPSHRELAESLVVAPLTVKKAYDELERDGYVHTRRGQGTFVSERPPRTERTQRLRQLAAQLVSEAYLAGVTPRELRDLVDQETARLDTQRAQWRER